MGYALYALVSLVEGTLFYIFMCFVLKLIDILIPPLGSSTFLMFLITWPFTAIIIRPGLHSIPIIGDAFALIAQLATSGFASKE
ncbi:MAG TPA: hypothetical protein PKW76_06165 [bacterium]|nr:hypothetical protein [bacterium]HPG45243.1 hypothetical protein [bacterium]HPM99038.1 hypothetical protein [bacterium]